jgi:hypothetical protein
VTIDGYTQTSHVRTITFWEPSGVYAYLVHGDRKWKPVSRDGTVDLTRATVNIKVQFR